MYKVSIDRIGLVFPTADKSMHGFLCGAFHSMQGEDGFKVWKTKYQTNAVIALSPRQTLRLQAGVSHHKTYLRVDFNPAGLAVEEWGLLKTHLSYLLEYGYDSVVVGSNVSYLEIAVDFTGVQWKGLLPFDALLRNSNWFPDFYHPTPTGYLGRRGSERVIRGYDRVANLLAKGRVAPDYPVTRIEAVMRKLGCKVADLPALKNPFKLVGLCRLVDAEAQSNDLGWKQFLKHCRYVGACEALQLVGTAKKMYLNRLQNICCDWWCPKQIWTTYPTALQVLKGSETPEVQSTAN